MALTALRTAAQHAISRAALWALKGGYHVPATLAGPLTLDTTFPVIVGLDPGGAARIITLDGAATAVGDPEISGLVRIIVNRAAGVVNLTVNDALANLIATLNQNEAGVFYHDPDTGWALVFVVTIALA